LIEIKSLICLDQKNLLFWCWTFLALSHKV